MQCAPSRPLSRPHRFLPAAAGVLVSIALIAPCQAGPEFTAVNGVNAPASGQSSERRTAPASASMQTFGTLVSPRLASQPQDRPYAPPLDLGTGDLSAGAIRSMPASTQTPRTPR